MSELYSKPGRRRHVLERACVPCVRSGFFETLEKRTLMDAPKVSAFDPTGTRITDLLQLRMDLTSPVTPANARSAGTHRLTHLGANGVVGGGDDTSVPLFARYADGTARVTLERAENLRSWTTADYFLNLGLMGKWQSPPNGETTEQSLDGGATFLLSAHDLGAGQFTGRVSVNDGGADDDFIGVVFGLTLDAATGRPESYYLLSWKGGAQGTAEQGLKLAKVTATGASGYTPDLWDLEQTPTSHVQLLGQNLGTGWQHGDDYDFDVTRGTAGEIQVRVTRAADGGVVWSHQVTDPAPLGPGRVGFYNLGQAGTRYSAVSHTPYFDAGNYAYEALSGPSGLAGVDGTALDGNGDGTPGDGFNASFTVAPPPAIIVDLRDADDTGVSSTDNVTAVRAPTFDVTVNRPGTFEIDFDGDGTPEVVRAVPGQGVYQVTAPTFADGTRTILATFRPAADPAVSSSLVVTVDSQPPRMLPGTPAVVGSVSSRTAKFTEAIQPPTAAQVAIVGPGGRSIPVMSVTGSGDTYTISFPAQNEQGDYEIRLASALRDVAGNAIDQDADGTGGEPTDGPIDRWSLTRPNSLTLSAVSAGEGAVLQATVERTLGPSVGQPLVLNLSGSIPGQLQLPPTVTIPAGQLSATFEFTVVGDTLVERNESVTVSATAAGFSASAALQVIDDDVPTLSLAVAPATISEAAGPNAATGTVTRSVVTDRPFTIKLFSSNSGKVTVPLNVVIPANQASVSFPLGAVDNGTFDGASSVTITANGAYDTCGCTIVTGAGTAVVNVVDDEGPSIRLTLGSPAVAEGGTVTATVSRQGDVSQPLTLTLLSADPTEATVPAQVTIPAGQQSASFSVLAPNDGTTDGRQTVLLTASAPGFLDAATNLDVIDIHLPDLVVSSVLVPAAATTDASFNLTYRVTNAGAAAAGGTWQQRVYLSPDDAAGNDTLVGTFSLTVNLAPGQYYERTIPVRAPNAPGAYWPVVTDDLANAIDEFDETNNTTVGSPVAVASEYSADVKTDVTTAVAGTPVALSGLATLSTGGPAAFRLVNIHVLLAGSARVISALTDATGAFSATFYPLPGEAGEYTVFATHPGVRSGAAQDQFTLVGFRAEPSTASHTLVEGGAAVPGTLTLRNLSGVPLTGVQALVLTRPANVNVSLSHGNGAPGQSIPGNGTLTLTYGLSAPDASTGGGAVLIRVTTAQGATVDVTLNVSVDALRPQLAVDPSPLNAAMRRGEQTVVRFTVRNDGGAPTGPVSVALPDVSWMYLAAGAQIPSLSPGQSHDVTLLLQPPASLLLTAYRGSIALNPEFGSALQVPFDFRAVDAGAGTLTVTVVDEYYYLTPAATKLAGATVSIRDAVTNAEVHSGISDAAGRVVTPTLPVGYYRVRVSAADHTVYDGTTFVGPSGDNALLAFVSRNTVKYTWSVVPTTIPDQYDVTVQTTFETNVPAPVVVIEPGVIDLADLDVVGDQMQVDLRITNHGLIAANNVRLDLGNHPFYEITPLIRDVGTLPAKSSLVIPVTIRRVADFGTVSSVQALADVTPMVPADGGVAAVAAADGSVPCFLGGHVIYSYECGPDGVWRSVPVGYVNGHWGQCWAPAPGGDPGPGGGGDGGGGGGVIHPVPVELTSLPCIPCEALGYEKESSLGETFLASLAETAAERIVSLVPWLTVDDLELELTLKYSASPCCVDGKLVGWNESITGTAGFSVTVFVGLDVGRDLGTVNIPGLGAAGLKVVGRAGAFVTLEGSVSASATKSCEGDWEFCVNAELSLAIDVGVEASGVVTYGDKEYSADLEAKVKAGGSLAVSYCFGRGWKTTGCYDDVQFVVSAGVTIDETPYTTDLLTIELVDGTCDDAPAEEAVAAAAQALPGDDVVDAYFFAFVVSADALVRWFGYSSVEELERTLFIDLQDRVSAEQLEAVLMARAKADTAGAQGVCATVKLRLDQTVTLTREAFQATLEISNGSPAPLENIGLTIVVRNRAGQDVTHLFQVRSPVVQNIAGGVAGNGTLATGLTGSAQWVLVPAPEAAVGGLPTDYLVTGTLVYRESGIDVTVPLTGVVITIHPQPELSLDYFWQRDVVADDPHTDPVEPSVPFEVAVLVNNQGAGTATGLRIESAQPVIVDNEKGLLIDFEIIATQVDGQSMTPSLTASFGDLAPGRTAVARWLMTSTLHGLFTDYEATFRHISSLGDSRFSLVKDVRIHEMIRSVFADNDGLRDFLVNDSSDPLDLPDRLYLSNGTNLPVNQISGATFGGSSVPVSRTLTLTTDAAAGWGYLRVADPGQGAWRVARVARADGSDVPVTNFWQTDRTFLGLGKRPVYEDMLHLVDLNPAGSYTVHFEPLDVTAPTPSVSTPRPAVGGQGSLAIGFSEPVANFDLADLRLSRDGGANLLAGATTVHLTSADGQHWTLSGLRDLTASPGTYSLTFAAGNDVTDAFGNRLTAVGQTSFLVLSTVSVEGRHLFYNNSRFDGNNALATAADDGAIATDKRALLPGQTATFANYTSYSRGINGMMVDVLGAPGTTFTTADFAFKVGNSADPATWINSAVPTSISLRPGGGVNGSDRVTILWADNAIQKQWLQITVLANANTGLTSPDVFYFGNAVGESGNSTTDARVNSTDEIAARNNPRGILNLAPVDFRYDYNRDGRVNSTDELIARDNPTGITTALRLITAPSFPAPTSSSAVTPAPAGPVYADSAEVWGSATVAAPTPLPVSADATGAATTPPRPTTPEPPVVKPVAVPPAGPTRVRPAGLAPPAPAQAPGATTPAPGSQPTPLTVADIAAGRTVGGVVRPAAPAQVGRPVPVKPGPTANRTFSDAPVVAVSAFVDRSSKADTSLEFGKVKSGPFATSVLLGQGSDDLVTVKNAGASRKYVGGHNHDGRRKG